MAQGEQPAISGLWDRITVDPFKSNATKESAQIKAHQKETTDKAAKNLSSTDKDCANYGGFGGALDFLCVGGKSVTKGFGGLGAFVQNPMFLLAIVAIVGFAILVLLKR